MAKKTATKAKPRTAAKPTASTAMVRKEQIREESPLATFERMASDTDVDVEKFERFMQMREREMARLAREQFNIAMTSAQREMRMIATDADNPQTRSRYASYAKLDKALRPIYTGHGFGLSFNTTDSPLPEHMRLLCEVSHIGGHSKAYQIDMPADGKGAKGGDVMTKTHAMGAAASYGMRYLLRLIWNVAVGEDDDDGNGRGRRHERPGAASVGDVAREYQHEPRRIMPTTSPAPQASSRPPAGTDGRGANVISEKQAVRFWKLANTAGLQRRDVEAWLVRTFKLARVEDMKREDYDYACEQVEAGRIG